MVPRSRVPDLLHAIHDADDRLVYRGAPDADYNDPSLNAEWLRAALDAVLEGKTPQPAEAAGCAACEGFVARGGR